MLDRLRGLGFGGVRLRGRRMLPVPGVKPPENGGGPLSQLHSIMLSSFAVKIIDWFHGKPVKWKKPVDKESINSYDTSERQKRAHSSFFGTRFFAPLPWFPVLFRLR